MRGESTIEENVREMGGRGRWERWEVEGGGR